MAGEPSMTDVLVAIGRIEAMMAAMNDKLDKLESQTDDKFRRLDGQVDVHWKKLGEHDTAIKLLQEQAPRRVAWWTISSSLIAIATLVILVLDRFYVNQGVTP